MCPPSKKNSFGEKIYKKIPNDHNNLLGPRAKELCTQVQKTLIKKIEKNSWKIVCKPITAFWVHGLTNVQPT